MVPVELFEEEQKVITYAKKHSSIKRAEAQKLLAVSDTRAKYVFSKIEKAGLLRLEGRQKGVRYLLHQMDNFWTKNSCP